MRDERITDGETFRSDTPAASTDGTMCPVGTSSVAVENAASSDNAASLQADDPVSRTDAEPTPIPSAESPKLTDPAGTPDNDSDAQPPVEEARHDVLHFASKVPAEPTDTAPSVPELPPEEILFQREYCLHYKNGACNRCEVACPHAAISFDEHGWGIIDHDACTCCGICYGVCDAFISSRINLTELWCRAYRLADFDNTLYITCSENVFPDMHLAENVLVVPCLAALPPEFIASVLGEGIRIIIVGDLNYCDNCTLAGDRGEMLYSYAFQTAEQWSGKAIEYVETVPEATSLVERINQDSRRDAISGLISAVGDITSGHYRTTRDSNLRAFEDQRAVSRSSAFRNIDFNHPLNQAMRRAGHFKLLFPRREFLLKLSETNKAAAARIPVMISTTDASACTNAHDCVQTCITGARGMNDEGWLTFDSRYCIGCGLCVAACKQNACAIMPVTVDKLTPETVVADIKQIRAAQREQAARVADDGRKRAVDADSIYGTADAEDLTALL